MACLWESKNKLSVRPTAFSSGALQDVEECSVERARKKLVAQEHVGGLVLAVCVSVMNILCNGNKLNFKPRVLKERHLAPPPTLHWL